MQRKKCSLNIPRQVIYKKYSEISQLYKKLVVLFIILYNESIQILYSLLILRSAAKLYKKKMIEKPTLSIVFLGRVDSGKSTLAGRLLHSLGTVNDSIIERLQVESREFGFAKTHYANILSRTREETRRGRSIHLAYSRAETKHFHINIIDAPGNY